jgi:hypothetical protein
MYEYQENTAVMNSWLQLLHADNELLEIAIQYIESKINIFKRTLDELNNRFFVLKSLEESNPNFPELTQQLAS